MPDGTVPQYDHGVLEALGLGREGCRLLRLKDTPDTYVLEDGGAAYDALFALMEEHFMAGGGFLYLARLTGPVLPLLLEVSATKAEGFRRGERPAFGGQILRPWLYAPGDGVREALELKRTREYTKVHKLPPIPAWPGLWSPEEVPPIRPAMLGWLRALAAGDEPGLRLGS